MIWFWHTTTQQLLTRYDPPGLDTTLHPRHGAARGGVLDRDRASGTDGGNAAAPAPLRATTSQ